MKLYSAGAVLAWRSIRLALIQVALYSGGRPSQLADRRVEVPEDLDEIRQPGDVEDLPVVGGQAARNHPAALGPGAAQDAHDQRDPGRVDVADVGEVEHHRAGLAVRHGLFVSGVEHSRGPA